MKDRVQQEVRLRLRRQRKDEQSQAALQPGDLQQPEQLLAFGSKVEFAHGEANQVTRY